MVREIVPKDIEILVNDSGSWAVFIAAKSKTDAEEIKKTLVRHIRNSSSITNFVEAFE